MHYLMLMFMLSVAYQLSIPVLQNCQNKQCRTELLSCANDDTCMSQFNSCETICGSNADSICYKTCLATQSSHKLSKLLKCSVTKNCFNEMITKVACPSSCLEPVKTGDELCRTETLPSQYECIVEYLHSNGYPECADKNCVCSNSITLNIFVGGCRC